MSWWDPIHRRLRAAGLVRARRGRLIGGVCAGLARRLGWNPWVVRVAYLVVPCGGPLVYLLLWVVLPLAEGTRSDDRSRTDEERE